MKLRLLFLVFCLLAIPRSYGQEGCFKRISDGVTLETSIDFSGYDAFFVGEFHGVYGVPEIKLAIIKYLNKQCGITDVFMECSYSAAWLYNMYLSTGDTSYLTDPQMIFFMKAPYRAFFTGLYAYNKTIPYKIKIRGMDFERIEFLKVLKALRPRGVEKPKEIATLLTYLDTVKVPQIARLHSEEFKQQNLVYESFRESISKNRELYRQYFGQHFHEVEEILLNESTYNNYAKRNKTMYRNMVNQIEEDGIKKFVTFNGMNHGDKNNRKWRTLCYRLAHYGKFKGRLTDMAMVCKNCFDWQLQPEYRHAALRGVTSYISDTALVNGMYEKYYNSNCAYTIIPTAKTGDKRVEGSSEYLVLMKDQPEF